MKKKKRNSKKTKKQKITPRRPKVGIWPASKEEKKDVGKVTEEETKKPTHPLFTKMQEEEDLLKTNIPTVQILEKHRISRN